MKNLYILSVFIFILFVAAKQKETPSVCAPNFKENLSEYGFFEGTINAQQPAADVVPYALNAPLFSDYAQKLRFIRLPKGATVAYNADSVLQFPVGTAIIKTFFYANDAKNEKKGRRLIETRLLLHEENGWVALPYVWNAEQTDATLDYAGGDAKVVWKDEKGTKQTVDYVIPNRNQCRSCHERGGVMTPIGPSVRQLNGDFKYAENAENQLINWKKRNILSGLPDDLAGVPKVPNYADASAKLEDRARGYLDINCGHCHNPKGQAFTSGLFLDWKTQDSTALGFYKTPVAAGKGSGNLRFDIVKGKPSESILVYRMKSTDAGEMMPELSRKRVHTEGVELIKEWIKTMK
ncbi:MAG: SO2930 family diheme c-type cytochrome [Saprospiraceae bacterium]|nr:SO2930 family diheme c-type cytochrome [Saprospiraceae bacterium]